MKHQKLLFTVFFLTLASRLLHAQVPPVCPIPPPVGAENCFDACVYCDLDGHQGILNGTPSGGNTVCGSIEIHNDQWFGFTAGTSTIVFEIQTSNCLNGDGLQAAIFESCDDIDPLVCNPGAPGGGSATLLLEYTGYVVGQTYFLLLDGWSADVCDFTIIVTDGSTLSPPVDAIGAISGPSSTCQYSTNTYTIQPVYGAGFYTWSAPPGASINGQGNVVSVSAQSGTSVEVDFGNVAGDVCVRAENACNSTTSDTCFSVDLIQTPLQEIPPITLCYQDLPFFWSYSPFYEISSPGIYTLQGTNGDGIGCDTIIRQKVIIKPEIYNFLGHVGICPGDCFTIGDSTFCQPGPHSIILTSVSGCDSLVDVIIVPTDPGLAAQIFAPQGQILNCFTTGLELNSTQLANTTRIWKNMAGDTLGTGTSIQVTEPGFYTLEVKSNFSSTCSGLDKILIKQNNYPPPVTASGGVLDANNPTVQLMDNSILSGMIYHWTGPNGFTSSLKKPIVSVPGFYTLTVTNPQTGCSTSITVEVIQII